jgi:cytochrome c oxidase subunit 2
VRAFRATPVIIVGAVFVAIGVFVGLTARVLPVAASAEAAGVDSLFSLLLAVAVVIFLIVEVGLLYAVIRFRRRPGDDSDGEPMHGNTGLEIIWTAIPAFIVVVLAFFSFQVFASNNTPRDNEVVVGVVGQQFKWSFEYEMPPDPGTSEELRQKIKTYMISVDLHLPVNRGARMEIRSNDVIHAFYVPEFRIKQDAMPGRVSTARFTPTLKGEYRVVCAELCGLGHAAMSQNVDEKGVAINVVKVEDQADYDKFVDALYVQAKANATNPRAEAVGKQLVTQKYPCGACHLLDDAGLHGNIGPSLNGIATRAQAHFEKGEGILGTPKDLKDYIRSSILNPNLYVVSGYNPGIMPQNYGDRNIMPEDDLEAIVNYLSTIK